MTGQCEQKQSANEGPFLGAVTSGSLTQWKETIEINNKQAQFKLDTGAEVTAISEATYKRIGKPYLDKVSKSLPYGGKLWRVQTLAKSQGKHHWRNKLWRIDDKSLIKRILKQFKVTSAPHLHNKLYEQVFAHASCL